MNSVINRATNKLCRIRDKQYIKKESCGSQGHGTLNENTYTHITYCKVRNAGDTVLSQCVRKTFQTYLPKINWNIKSIDSVVDADLIEEINATKGLIIGGGGYFCRIPMKTPSVAGNGL